jgi:putative membrane protein
MRIIMIIFYVLLILIGVSFAGLNSESVHINLYITSLNIPISLLMITMLAAGTLIGFFLFFIRYWRLRTEHRRMKNQLKIMEKEIKNLRAIPLQDQH